MENENTQTVEVEQTESLEAPEETIVEDVGEEKANENAEQATETQEETTENKEDEPKKPSRAQRRISQEIERRKQANQETDYWKQKAEEAERKASPQPAFNTDPKDPAPDISKFDDADKFSQASQDWNRRQVETQVRQEQQTQSARQEQRVVADAFQERMETARGKIDDFDEVLSDSTSPSSPVLNQALTHSDMGPELLYHLCKNPKEAQRIVKLPPQRVFIEIGKLESKLTSQPIRTSKAPTPSKPVKPSAQSVTSDIDPSDTKAWINARNKKRKGR